MMEFRNSYISSELLNVFSALLANINHVNVKDTYFIQQI